MTPTTPIDILQEFWGHTQFRGSQETIIKQVLDKKDVLALLPTGGGKSVCYQIPALAQDGICIVVSPLIALIQDQVAQLQAKGIKALAITGGISFDDLNTVLDNALYGNYKFLYLSPERLQQELVQTRIQEMNVNLIAIDEAHCISQWGNDFRPAYTACGILRTLVPHIPIIALTATATEQVIKDIDASLHLKEAIVYKDSFARKNIVFEVIKTEDKRHQLVQRCLTTNASTLIYVRSRRKTNEISALLLQKGLTASFYHGGLTKEEKKKKQEDWALGKIPILVCTNAFGMGIDKADVRLVIHYELPDSVENYYQEAGRAGRDGETANAILLIQNGDEERLKSQFLATLPDVIFLKLIYNKLNNYYKVAYGEMPNDRFQLKLNSFCETYKLPVSKTYNALRILDQYSVLSLTAAYHTKTIIQFTSSKEQLFQYMDSHRQSVTTLQAILRSYGGVFDFETQINLPLISKKTGVKEQQIHAILNEMHKQELITYKAKHSDLEIVYLVPREDDSTINVFAKKIEQLQAIKTAHIDAIIAYTKTTECRSTFILKYFDEKTSSCRTCDNCTKNAPISPEIYSLVRQAIGKALKKKPQTSRDLITLIGYKETAVLVVLQDLLEEEKIQINNQNQYYRTV